MVSEFLGVLRERWFRLLLKHTRQRWLSISVFGGSLGILNAKGVDFFHAKATVPIDPS